MRAPVIGDRMAQAAAAAEDVDDVLVDAEHPGGGDAHRGEGLVDLPEVDVADVEAGAGERLRDRHGRGQAGVGRRHAGRGPRPHDRRAARGRTRRRAPSSTITMAAARVVDAAGVAGRDAEALDLGVQRLERGQLLHARVRVGGARRPRRCAVTPSRPVTSTGKISSAKLPASMAATARWCERSAQASISSRVTPALTAAFHPTVMDMSRFGASGVSRCVGDIQSSHSSVPGTRRVDRGEVDDDCDAAGDDGPVHAGADRRRPRSARRPGPTRSGGCGPRPATCSRPASMAA